MPTVITAGAGDKRLRYLDNHMHQTHTQPHTHTEWGFFFLILLPKARFQNTKNTFRLWTNGSRARGDHCPAAEIKESVTTEKKRKRRISCS